MVLPSRLYLYTNHLSFVICHSGVKFTSSVACFFALVVASVSTEVASSYHQYC
ncbi:hypothetical protein PBCV1_a341bR [Paramecium bursaria Chlorella virus 1]|uniref:Uncharacterized protein n=1 Tax=Paramecium bursaria Chlorella virus 1 TaxID=10506 RepID=F8TU22_PBCV1|nr:hypothetical protein PBCV1_a341bR [Paramecium bursaria Chlorella virus 1]AEI70083.1 hypothetical protein [Paramecium bursaria Chlorella virus 1]